MLSRNRDHSPSNLRLIACAFAALACCVVVTPATAVERDLDVNDNGIADWLESAPSVTLLGTLDEPNPHQSPWSGPRAITLDGRFITGRSAGSASQRLEAVRWSADGILSLGILPEAQVQDTSEGNAIAEDGGTVAMGAYVQGGTTYTCAVWRETDLPGYPGSAGLTRVPNASCPFLSSDGHWSFGHINGSNLGFFRFDMSVHPPTWVPIPEPHPDCNTWRARGMSADGQVIVGDVGCDAIPGLWGWEAIYYLGDDYTFLFPDNGTTHSSARGVSSDGNYVTGFVGPVYAGLAYRWRADTGEVVTLPTPGACTTDMLGLDISAGGSTIVGNYSTPIHGSRSFIWREGMGTRDLQAVLALAYGFEVAGSIPPSRYYKLSPDGRFLLNGVGGEAFVINLGPPDLAAETAVVFDPCVEPVDSDGDGVTDEFDLCPDTPAAEPVGATGCSDAQVDGDGDGACAPGAPSGGPSGCVGEDCSDNDPLNYPGNPEVCDGVDNNCDAAIDEGLPDTDADGVCDDLDACPGLDDAADVNGNATADCLDACGGAAFGQAPTSILCYNQTQRRHRSPAAGTPWDCEAAGMPVTSGDSIVIYAYGDANNPPAIGGGVTGMSSVDYVRCTNRSTGQRVYPALASPWDCEAAGLVVGPGERLRMTVVGTAR